MDLFNAIRKKSVAKQTFIFEAQNLKHYNFLELLNYQLKKIIRIFEFIFIKYKKFQTTNLKFYNCVNVMRSRMRVMCIQIF